MRFVFDIDGTICFDGKTIALPIHEILSRGAEYGHDIVFASGRAYRDCLPVLKPSLSKHYIVGLNGGSVHYQNDLLQYKTFPYDLYLWLSRFCLENNIPYFTDDVMDYHSFRQEEMPFAEFVDTADRATHRKLEEIEDPIKMIILLKEHLDKKDHLLQMIARWDVDALFFERSDLLYIQPKGCSKGTTLKELFGEYVCFGNDKNDLSMFEHARYGVQIGNLADLHAYSHEKIPLDQHVIDNLCESILTLYERFR
ncbi:MAG: HAD-IIB family hydrolase [Peptostreptococcaceae bacterium]|nr:HAD-IIB family hydrolase [Peptostreptococcaceae bacterium]